TVAVFDAALARQLRRYQVAAADQFGVFAAGFFQPANVFFRDDQQVSGALRMDILKGERMIVFVNLPAGYFALNHAAKQTVRHRRWISLPEFTEENSSVRKTLNYKRAAAVRWFVF